MVQLKRKIQSMIHKIRNKKDILLETLIILSSVAIYIALIITIWINTIFGLKCIATAVITLITAIIITILTQEEETNADTE